MSGRQPLSPELTYEENETGAAAPATEAAEQGADSSAADAAERERLLFRWSDLPLVTSEVPGTGGEVRTVPEDFLVTEIPAYLPAGRGSHRYLLVEKRGYTTRELVQALMRGGVEEKAIGVAGLKDKAAVTVQWLSVPKRFPEAVGELQALPGVTILDESFHSNKLGIGHLRGNRFEINIRGVGDGALENARTALQALQAGGAPNWFGPQRFGRFGTNAYDGLRVLRNESVPGGHRLRRFFLSALQSLIFNTILSTRIERGWFDTVVLGDWARKHDTGGTFLVTDPETDAERARRLEISATIPLFGRKVKPSPDVAGSVESEVLEAFGLSWARFGQRHGDRRSSRVLIEEASVTEPEPGSLALAFTLPKGSYATAVLREVMKVEVDAPFELPQSGEGESSENDGE